MASARGKSRRQGHTTTLLAISNASMQLLGLFQIQLTSQAAYSKNIEVTLGCMLGVLIKDLV